MVGIFIVVTLNHIAGYLIQFFHNIIITIREFGPIEVRFLVDRFNYIINRIQ